MVQTSKTGIFATHTNAAPAAAVPSLESRVLQNVKINVCEECKIDQ